MDADTIAAWGKIVGGFTAIATGVGIGWAWFRKTWILPRRGRAEWRRRRDEEFRVSILSMRANLESISGMRDTVDHILNRLVLAEQVQGVHLLESSAGYFRTDQDGAYLEINRELARLGGRVFEEFRGQGWQNLIAPVDRDRVVREWDQALADRREFECRFNYRRADGSLNPVRVQAYPYINAAGQFAGYLALVHQLAPDSYPLTTHEKDNGHGKEHQGGRNGRRR